jgi:hypothetical protein
MRTNMKKIVALVVGVFAAGVVVLALIWVQYGYRPGQAFGAMAVCGRASTNWLNDMADGGTGPIQDELQALKATCEKASRDLGSVSYMGGALHRIVMDEKGLADESVSIAASALDTSSSYISTETINKYAADMQRVTLEVKQYADKAGVPTAVPTRRN